MLATKGCNLFSVESGAMRTSRGFFVSRSVILIVFAVRKEIAYWLYVQQYFRQKKGFNIFAAGKTMTVSMPSANVVTPAAMRRFARFRDRVVEQMIEVTHGEE